MSWLLERTSSGSLLCAAAFPRTPRHSPEPRAGPSLRGSACAGRRESARVRAAPVGCRRTLLLAAPAATLLVMASLWPADASQAKPGQLYKKEGRSIYIVALGDTLSEIARRFRTTVEILMQANQLESSLIVPGQQLWTPQAYTIQKGDTLYAIAKKFGTTVDEILKINNIEDANKIRAGDIMLLP